jgi:MFS family permease
VGKRRGVNVPFKQAYAPNVALVILTLFPQLINTGTYPLLANAIAKDLHVPAASVLEYPLFNEAAFVFGILVGTTLIRKYNVRHVYVTMLAIDVVIMALLSNATSDMMMSVLNVFAGCVGGMFLMIALPPLFTNFDPKYFTASAALMVPCLFGASTLAPLLTGPLATGGLWRPLFWGELFVLIVAFVLSLFTVAPADPKQPDAPIDWFAIGIGAFSMACVFAGVHGAATHEWPYPPAIVPFVGGIAGFVILIVGEYRMDDGLLPFKKMLVAYAVIGFIGAAAGNAVYVADTQIFTIAAQHVKHFAPMQIAAATWPLFLMTIVTGLLFSAILKTKWVPLYTLSGLMAICIGSVLLFSNQRAATFLIGYGAGSTITPALFTVGLSMPRDIIARAIAAVEVVRLTIGFTSGPLAQHSIVAHAVNEKTVGAIVSGSGNAAVSSAAAISDLLRGIQSTMHYVVGFDVLVTLVVVVLLLKYYRNPHAPDFVRYIKEGTPAFDSPPLV